MKILIIAFIPLVILCTSVDAGAQNSSAVTTRVGKRDVLANDPDLFLPVTPDRLLTRGSRDEWLAMSQINARIYWEAWNCENRACDTPLRARIRANAKLVARTEKNFGLLYKPEG